MHRIDTTEGFSSRDVEFIAECLVKGGVGIIPTDTVYGLAALATSEKASGRLLELKLRPAGKPLPVQCSSISRAAQLAVLDSEPALSLARTFWPGALTMVLDLKPGVSMPFQGPHTIGVRIPDNSFCLALLELAGYLVVPSANTAGTAPSATAEEIQGEIIAGSDFLVDGGKCAGGLPSTVVDVSSLAGQDDGTGTGLHRCPRTGKRYRILREGAIPIDEIERAVNDDE